MGLQIISDRAFDVSPKGEVNHYDGSWYSTLLQPAMPKVIVLLASPLTDMLGEPVRLPGDDAGDDT
jgi:hypothetical protein